MDVTESPQAAAASTGEAGAAGASAGATAGAPAVSDDQARRDANAARKRKSRELKKLEAAAREAKKLAKLKGAPPPEAADQPVTSLAPPVEQQQPGWPSKEAQAAAMPSAVMLLTSAKLMLGTTRYGLALEPRSAEVQKPDGSGTETVTVDPIRDGLAPPLAAMLANANGAGATPGQVLMFNLATILGPVAVAHVAELAAQWVQRRRERAGRQAPATKPPPPPPAESKPAAPPPPPPPARPMVRAEVVDFARANGA